MTASMGRKVDWLLAIAGALLTVCGAAIFAAPGFFLEFLTVWAGVGFVVSGAAGLVSYFRMRSLGLHMGWNLLMSVLDIGVGVLLVAHPFAFAEVIPWLLGVAFIAFGILEVVGILPFAGLVPELRAVAIVAGVLSAVAGVMFIVWPESLSIWVAAFALVRGITLVAMAFTSRV